MPTAVGSVVTASDIEVYAPVFDQVARRAARSWPGIEADDISQEIWAQLLPKWKSLAGDDALMRAAAERVARVHCLRERYSFMLGTNEYIYAPREVRALFSEAYFDEAAREKLPDHHDTIYAGGVACAIWDLDAVYEKLSDDQRSVIERRYLLGQVLTGAEEKALSRAIEAATRHLNWRTEGRARVERDCD